MKKFGLIILLLGVASTFLFLRSGGTQSLQQSVPYQGQNTNRFQMFFSPLARADAYLVDTATGTVRQVQQATNGNLVFEVVNNEHPPIGGVPSGRFKMYFGPLVRSDAFLLDTQTGGIWQLFQDSKTNEMFLRKRTVQGIQ